MMIGLSRATASTHPALIAWLGKAGLDCAVIDPAAARKASAILCSSEQDHARADDVVLHTGSGAPSLLRQPGRASTLSFGVADQQMGYALAVELVRPAARPACADTGSARLLTLAARIAASDASVLVLGETGTGKEGIARYIHACSPRADGGFIAVNCAALPETMLEAILFGHRRGAFTGASADGEGLFRAASGGTLLLDEIADLPLPLQAKLLRALQEKEVLPVGATRPEPVDVRVIACANRDLAAQVAAGFFRADLYWRLNVMPLHLQPLRSRRDDIVAIAATMLLRHAGAGAAVPFPTAVAVDRLLRHDWPGNARELENVLLRAMLLRTGDRIDADDLVIEATVREEASLPATLESATRAAESRLIRAALDATGGHRLRAAEQLGISERTLRYRLAEMRAAQAA